MKSLKVGNSGKVKSKPERRYDIDWLRVLAMLSIFLFHCARFFNYGDWHVKNNQLDLGMSVFVSFVVLWIMPLFFLLAVPLVIMELLVNLQPEGIGMRAFAGWSLNLYLIFFYLRLPDCV